jgi:hypothetical protein
MLQAATGAPVTGLVVDAKGRPVLGAEVALAAGMTKDGTVPVLAQTRSDQAGKFHFPRPAPEKLASVDTNLTLWVHKPGLALGVVDLLRNDRRAQVHRIVLEEPAPRRLTIRDADGKPITAARIAPRIVETGQTGYLGITVPDDWLERLSALTDERGTAALPSLTRKIDLRGARVSVPGRGTHNLMLPYSKGKDDVTLTLPRAGGLEATIREASGAPVSGANVELWARSGVPLDDGRLFYLAPERLALAEIPAHTGADGSFHAPGRLLSGSAYRLVVRAEGFAPLVSGWFTASERSTALPAITLEKLRTLEGQVVDRQGQPVAGVSVFQPGDNPPVMTEESGRFRLENARPGQSFLLARKDGFRFHGQLIESHSKNPLAVTLTRQDERPERLMATLPPPLPLDESRALARRVLDPILKEATAKGVDAA